MIVYFISGIASASGFEEGAMQSDEWDARRHHTSKASAIKAAKFLVEEDAEVCRKDGMSEATIQENILVEIQKLELIQPTVSNVCKMLNGTGYVLSRTPIETVRPRRRKESSANT